MEIASRAPYGLVLICPKCPPKDYFGMLKTPGNKSAPCPNCGAALIAMRKRPPQAQALVELALVLPLVLFLLLGAVEVGFLLIAKDDQERATQVIADWAALHPGESWNSFANHELPDCDVTMSSPFRDTLEAASECPYHPRVLVNLMIFDNLTIGSREQSARSPSSVPSPTPGA